MSEQRYPTEEFHGNTIVGAALVISALAFGVWMLGVWLGDVHTSSRAIHAFGNLVAIVGAVGTVSCAWLAIRVWVIQHRR